MPGRRWSVSKELIKINRFTNDVSEVLPEKPEVVVENPANVLELHKVAYALRHPTASHRLRRQPSIASNASKMSGNSSIGFFFSNSYDVTQFRKTPVAAYSSEEPSIHRRWVGALRRSNSDPLSLGLLSKPKVEAFGSTGDAIIRPSPQVVFNGSECEQELSDDMDQVDAHQDDIEGLKELFLQWIHMLNFVLPFALGSWGFDASYVFS